MNKAQAVQRTLPELNADNIGFWQSGQKGVLRIQQCQSCQHFIHPPRPVCGQCLEQNLASVSVSGRGKILTYTINHQSWLPGMKVPFTIAIVELEEQAGLQLTTNITDIDPANVRIGMDVEVHFEQHDDVWLPLFRPANSSAK